MEEQTKTHEFFMQKALNLALQAYDEGEVPVGAILVHNNMIIGKGYNQVERLRDATAHAEMIAITSAAEYLNSKYLIDCTLYVTLEPCLMCGGALVWSQVPKIVYGASDENNGCISTAKHLFPKKVQIENGYLQEACQEILLQFFREKRA